MKVLVTGGTGVGLAEGDVRSIAFEQEVADTDELWEGMLASGRRP